MSDSQQPLSGWNRWCQLKLRFGMARLPLFPVRYRLHTPGLPDVHFLWTRVMAFMDPVKGAFNYDLWGWDVPELRFLHRFLRPGMTVLDVGAHHGLYAVLAARQVGPTGRVIAFEPAPSVRRRLGWHLRLNRADRVEVHGCALGARAARAALYVPTGGVDTISSLRPPGVGEGEGGTQQVTVDVMTLDEFAAGHALTGADLIKLDVEGGELDVLAGAERMIREFRPLWLFEALDVTAAAWQGSGRSLVERFIALGCEVFEITPDGRLRPHVVQSAYPHVSNCNFLAVPSSRIAVVEPLRAQALAGDAHSGSHER